MSAFAKRAATPAAVAWRAAENGRGWSPIPEPGEGPLTEEDLYLWRMVFDLAPEGASVFLTLDDHPTQRQYVAKESMAYVDMPVGVTPEGGREGPGGLLVRPQRFGQIVEMMSFAGRDEAGVEAQVFVVPSDEAGSTLGEVLGTDQPVELASHCLAWGSMCTPGPTRAAAFDLRRGSGEVDLAAHVARFETRLVEEAAQLTTGDRQTQRRLLVRLIEG